MAKHAKVTTVRFGYRACGALAVAAAGLLATQGAASAEVSGNVLGKEFQPIEGFNLPEPIHACDNGATIGDLLIEVPTDDATGCEGAAAGSGHQGGPRQA